MNLLDGPEAERSKETPRGKGRGSWVGSDEVQLPISLKRKGFPNAGLPLSPWK